jgi:hypothetical protein
VEYLASIGCTAQEIADLYKCSRDTIYARFRQELTKGRAEGKKKLRDIQWDIARKGNAAMAIFLGKNQLGQSDQGLTDSDEERPPFTE